MRRTTLNFAIDLATLGAMLVMIATGLVMKFTLPPRTGGRLSVWGMDRHEWGDVHFWFAVALLAALLVHAALHWSWVCLFVQRLFVRSKRGMITTTASPPASRWRRDMYGALTLAVLIALVGGFQWVASAGITERAGGAALQPGETIAGRRAGNQLGESRRAGQFVEFHINGAMTIGAMADALDLRVERIAEKLELPADLPTDSRLGRLCQTHGMRLSDVRRAASELRAGNAQGSRSAPSKGEPREGRQP